MRYKHTFPPVYNEQSRLLILGSFPSVASREQQFYYGHPQNRFWRLLAALCGEATPQTVEQKKALCLMHGVAPWDVIESCEIEGSSDSSIRDVAVNDLTPILTQCRIREIYANGSTAWRLFQRYQRERIGRDAVKLPSTSPANAAWSFDRLEEAWQVIEDDLL